MKHKSIWLRYLNYCSLTRQWWDYSRILPSTVKNAKTKCVHFISILNFIQTFRHSVIRREIRFYSLFWNFKYCTRGGILYTKNNPYRTSGPMSLHTFHQLIASAFGYKQRSPQQTMWLAFLSRAFPCWAPTFLRITEIYSYWQHNSSVFTNPLLKQMKTGTYNHITYNVDYQSDFYTIPN